MASRIAFVVLALLLSLTGQAACASVPDSSTLPAALSDEDFWRLSTEMSEPAGAFRHSDNLVSNEAQFAQTVGLLRPRGGVYIGVGPEQNFSFIARLQPALAFIVDIREENRHLHLMYKALFGLSIDRADFISRLFSRERPAAVDPRSSVDDLFTTYAKAPASSELHEATARLVRERLIDVHRFPLSIDDMRSISRILMAFYSDGIDIHYGRLLPPTAAGPSYRALMTARDIRRQSRSYLATDEAFGLMKDMQAKNLIVPVVGDFAGPGAIRRIGDYVRQQGGFISAFYGSNVQVYLSKQQMAAFCENLATLPYDSRTFFIGNKGLQRLTAKLTTCSPAR